MSSLIKGRLIGGRYRILGKLATGGMAEVYQAEMQLARGISRVVALKRALPHLSRDPKALAMFLDEAKLISQLNHPGLVSTLDVFEDGSDVFIAMEFIPGWDLYALLEALREDHGAHDKVVPVAIALRIALEVARTLAYVHTAVDATGEALHVVHRDVNPTNILLGSDGGVRLIDFGVARARQRLCKTTNMSIKGKLCYLAPEQVSGENIGSHTDIYGLGLTLFEMFTGQIALSAATEQAAILRASSPDHQAPSALNPSLPPSLDGLVEQLLDKNPTTRPTASDIVPVLEQEIAARPAEERWLTLPVYLEKQLGTSSRSLEEESTASSLDEALAFVAGVHLTAETKPPEAPETSRAEAPLPAAPKPPKDPTSAPKGITTGLATLQKSLHAKRTWVLAFLASTIVVLGVMLSQTVGTLQKTEASSEPAEEGNGPPHSAFEPGQRSLPAGKVAPEAYLAPADKTLSKNVGPKEARPRRARSTTNTTSESTRSLLGRLDVASSPWAEVRLGNRLLAESTPAMGIKLPVGTHRISLTNPQLGIRRTYTVEVKANQPNRLVANLR